MQKVILGLAVVGVLGYLGYAFMTDGIEHGPKAEGGQEVAQPAQPNSGGDADNKQQAKSPETSGQTLFDLRQFEKAGPQLEKESAVAREAGNTEKAATLLDLAATAYDKIGNSGKALELWNAVATEFSSSPAAANALYNIGTNVTDTERRKEYFEKASKIKGTEGSRRANAALADQLTAEGKHFDARELLVELYRDVTLSDSERITLEDKMIELNQTLLFSKTETPDTELYKVKPGDSLSRIAKNTGVEVGIIRAMNRLTGNNIRVGQLLKISKGNWKIEIDKSRFTLLVAYNGSAVKRYQVAVGKNNQTPTGDFKIFTKLENPVYYKTLDNGMVKAIPADNVENVLGTRWMGFADPWTSYGIHGTTAPESIGTAASEGCIRMINNQVEELFEWVPRGMIVTIQE